MKSDSISKLIKELVAIPSQGGVDSCDLMIAAVSAWLKAVDACLDTATVGDTSKRASSP